VSDVVKDYSRTVLWRVSGTLPVEQLDEQFAILRRNAEKDFQSEAWHGPIKFQPTVDLRYRGQGYEINVAYSKGTITEFAREHQRRYGYNYPGREVELVTLRLRASMKSSQLKPPTRARAKVIKQQPERALVFFRGKKSSAAIYAREMLSIGKKYPGPAVVTEYSATTVVPPGMGFHLDLVGNLIIEVR
jgi:N-methylhydantoinase A